jgi:hypothetical protein
MICIRQLYIQSERKLGHGLSILWFLFKNEKDVADGSLETKTLSVRRGQYTINGQNTFSDGTASIPLRYRVKLSEIIVTQLR